ncbi:MAG TPA: hypothetical protein VFZ32_17905 [Micromonosporaceae bacterium]
MSLDDLLHAAPEHRERPDPAEISARILVRILAASAVAGFAAYQLLLLAGYRVPYPLLLAVPAAGLLARRITVRAHGQRVTPEPTPDDVDDEPPRDAAYGGIWRWVSRLSEPDRAGFRRAAHPMIVGVVDERLWLRHGVDRRSDPGRARALVPDELWRFVTSPPRRMPRPARLTRLVRQIERL